MTENFVRIPIINKNLMLPFSGRGRPEQLEQNKQFQVQIFFSLDLNIYDYRAWAASFLTLKQFFIS